MAMGTRSFAYLYAFDSMADWEYGYLIAELDPGSCALLILPGGDGWLDSVHATVALAAAGILDDRAHTSKDLAYSKAVCPSYRGEANYLHRPAVTDRGLITATGVASAEFANEVLRTMGLLSDEALEAWLGLYRSHEPKHYFQLMASLPDAKAN
jgi:hypothetical protein